MADKEASVGCLLYMGLMALGFATWITHIVVCLRDGEWGFLIAGALFFPVAMIHGFGCWFGWWG